MKYLRAHSISKPVLFAALCLIGTACSNNVPSNDGGGTPSLTAANLSSVAMTVTGAATTKGSVTVSTSALYASGNLVRFNDPWGSKEIDVDLGTYAAGDFGGETASISLVAEAQNYPLNGGAYPVLTSFNVQPSAGGGTIEYVNVTNACRTSGMWTCSGGYCDPNPSCTVSSPSGFFNRSDWDQHQVPPFGYVTTNSFPRCDSNVSGWSACPTSGGLPAGHYHAKYLLLSDSGGSVAGRTANLKVSVVLKKDTQSRDATSTNGGVNVNVILVGDRNINDASTAAGTKNLNLLFKEVNRLFSVSSGSKIFINQVKMYGWTDANGGSEYSQTDYTKLGDLFERGSKGVDAADGGKNINIFIVSDIEAAPGSLYTILGLSGAILGPAVNGTQTSGLAFSSFNKLASYNNNAVCVSATNCPREGQQGDFLEMAATITHEMGHYLGLNHPSEKADNSGAQTVDQLSDTPTCTRRASGLSHGNSDDYVLDQRACYSTDTTVQPSPLGAVSCASACNTVTGGTGASISNSYMAAGSQSLRIEPWVSGNNSDMPGKFCPAVKECQFNHVMWYTTKNRHLQKISDGSNCSSTDAATPGTCQWYEDGNLFAPESQAILQWDPFVR